MFLDSQYNNKVNGGGSILHNKYAGKTSHLVKNDLWKQVYNFGAAWTKKYVPGKKVYGGYFVLKNIREKKGSTMFWDVWILTDSDSLTEKYFNLYTKHNNTDAIKEDFYSFRTNFNGLARMIRYQKKGTANYAATYLIEGYVKGGYPRGFVRYLNAYSSANFIGYMSYLSRAEGKGILFRN